MSKMPKIPKEQSSFGGSANLDGEAVRITEDVLLLSNISHRSAAAADVFMRSKN